MNIEQKLSRCVTPFKQDDDDDDDRKQTLVKPDDEEATFMNLPIEIREKIYTFINLKEFVNLRLVCNQLRLESEFNGYFHVKLTEEHGHLEHTTIPFPHLSLLVIDNNTIELPWGDCCNDAVQSVLLQNLTFKTFIKLGKLRSVEDATLTNFVFERPIPPLSWNCLKSLQIVFHIEKPQQLIEKFMLENLDTLFQQQFDTLQNFRISLINPYLHNLQSEYSVRLARFVSNHWQTLQSLEMEVEGETCNNYEWEYNHEDYNEDDNDNDFNFGIPHHFSPSSSQPSSLLTVQEKENFLKVRLQNLELRVTEVSCPRCSIWQEFLQQQTRLKCLLLNIVDAGDLSSNFFCNSALISTQFQDLVILSINFWGVIQPYYPFDMKYFASSKKLCYFELARHQGLRCQVTRSELMNIDQIPEKVNTLVLDGFLIESTQITQLLQRLENLKKISLLNCGSGLDMGLNSSHCSTLASMKKINSCLLDFNTESENYQKSMLIIKSKISQLFSSDYCEDKWIWKHFGQNEFDQDEDYHRFLFSRNTKHDSGDCGFNIYDALTKPPPSHYDEEEKAIFQSMKELVLTSRFRGLLYDLATINSST